MAVFSFLSSERKRRGRIIPKRQTKPKRWRALRTAPRLENLEDRVVPAGTWTALTNLVPSSTGTGTMMLLTDGTVMAQGGSVVKTWYQLKPDSTGSYVNGTWSQLASMSLERLYMGSNVLPDGRVFVVGGEYSGPGGAQNFTNTGEIYNPLTNSWTSIQNFPQSRFGDDPTEVLADGRILGGYLSGPQTYLYNPATNTWTAAGTKLRNDQSDEETWVMLPDHSILSYDVFSSINLGVGHAQRYVPSTNTWVDTGNLPALLSTSAVGFELGPTFLLPDGRVFQIGANSKTAYYNPSSNTWTAGPDVPNSLAADDAPGAVLPNGHILFAADTPLFRGPTSVFEFDPTTNTYTNVTPPSSVLSLTGPSYPTRMVVLPTGQVLMTNGSSTRLAVYTPDGSANAAWKPTITSIAPNGDGSYTLTGTQLNGLSEGASYGDDAEMSSNYPIVRLVDNVTGKVSYARTFGWTAQVATGSTPVSTQFTLPAGVNLATSSVSVVANGIASAPFVFGLQVAGATPSDGTFGSVANVRVTFNMPIQPATFTTDQASLVDPTGNAIPVTINPVGGSNNTQFDVSFNAQTTLGVYTLTVGPNILDLKGNAMDQDGDGVGGQVPDDQFVDKFSIQGPKVIASSPSGSALPSNVDHVRVTFSEPMDPTTFGTDQVSFTGPNGPIPIKDVVTVDGSTSTQFDVLFDPVAATGTYDMVIGPNVQDFFGNAMDQNGNFVTGEVPGDQYEAKFSLQGPKIIASSIAPGTTPSFLPGTLTSVQVTFNEPMDPTTFGNDQVVFTAPDGSTFLATDIVTVAGSNSTKFNILFAANVTGSYVMTIGPNIRDAFGNAMDQNGNLNTGEIPDDQYVLKFNVLGPRINFSTTIGDNTNQLFNDVRVTFNEPMDPTTFTADQVVFTGPGGSTIPVTSITPVAGTNNTQFDLGFAPQGKIGNYTMTIGPDVEDPFGNQMDQNGNLKPGEIPGDQFVTKFTVFGPRINLTTPSSSLEPITSLRVTFSKPIDVTTFTPAKIASFRGPNGPLGISGIFAVPGTNFTQFDVDFLPQSTTGTYTMVIGPDIHDLAGSAMDQNGNLIPGEVPGDQFTATFSFGSFRITTSSVGGNSLPGLDHVRLTFNEPVNPATFTPAQIVSLTGPGGALTVNAVTAVPFTNNTQFDVSFDPLGTTGKYSLVVAPTMQDLYGNKLDQNSNLITGEDPADRFTMTFGILGPKVTGAGSLKSGLHTISGVRLTFNEPMDPTSFTLDQAVLQSPTGATIPITDVSPVDGSVNVQFDVSFAPQSTGGSYTLTVGPNVLDGFGNAMDQNGNLIPGEIPGDQFVTKFDPSQTIALFVGSSSTGWNDGSLLITQVSTSQFATRSFAGFDEIWIDNTVFNRDPNVYNRAADLAAFVSAGGGLVTDAAFTDYGFAPNAGTIKAVGGFSGNDVKETTLGKSHPILAGITDAGLSNWFNSWHSYFSATGGMDVLATSSDPTQALILAGTFGSGRLVYFGLDPTFHWPAGQSVQLMRQAAQWASAFHPGVEPPGGSGGFPGTPSVAPPAPAGEDASPADRAFASIGKQTVLASRSSLDGVLAVNALTRTSSTTGWTVLKGPSVPAASSYGASAMDPLIGPAPREELPLSLAGVNPEARSATDPFDSLADFGEVWNWEA
jgi:hypothetical protein